MIASHLLAAAIGAVLALVVVWVCGVWRDWKLLRRHHENPHVIDLASARLERRRGPR